MSTLFGSVFLKELESILLNLINNSHISGKSQLKLQNVL